MSDMEVGHWVTIDEHPVFIRGEAGSVPARLRSPESPNRFSKAALQRHIIAHHVETGHGYTAADEKALNEAAGAGRVRRCSAP